jgi:hypothetical protein
MYENRGWALFVNDRPVPQGSLWPPVFGECGLKGVAGHDNHSGDRGTLRGTFDQLRMAMARDNSNRL